MTCLLDTDTCIHLLRGDVTVVSRARKQSPGDLAISAITHYELLYGAERCPADWQAHESSRIHRLLQVLTILPFSHTTSAHAAKLRATLDKAGTPIGPMDLLIASTALEFKLPLVTGNLREFQKVPGLICETWKT